MCESDINDQMREEFCMIRYVFLISVSPKKKKTKLRLDIERIISATEVKRV